MDGLPFVEIAVLGDGRTRAGGRESSGGGLLEVGCCERWEREGKKNNKVARIFSLHLVSLCSL